MQAVPGFVAFFGPHWLRPCFGVCCVGSPVSFGVEKMRNMAVHRLKTWQPYFQDLRSGKKTFELRKNDRNFRVDDVLVCEEWDQNKEEYTSRKLYFRVPYVIVPPSWGALNEGYIGMSLKALDYPTFLVIETADEYGVELSDDEAGWLLWNETGYPSFWDTGMETDLPRQIAEWCNRKMDRHE